MREVTDPAILKQLNGTPQGFKPVSDPAVLAQLNGMAQPQPETPAPPKWATQQGVFGKYGPDVYGAAGAALETARPLIEMGGMVGGGLLGTPGGPAGEVAGAGLGYAGAKELTKAGDVLLGNKPEAGIAPLTDYATRNLKVPQSIRNVLSGAEMQMEGDVGGKVIGKGIELGGKILKPVLGRLSGTGTGAVEEALKSGKTTGLNAHPLQNQTAFDEALRGKISPEDVVDNAKSAINELRSQRANEYRQQLSEISANNKELDITPLRNKLQSLMEQYNVKIADDGTLDTSRIAMGKTGRNDIEDIINTVASWGTKPGDNTAVGLDTLKRQLDDFYSASSQARQFTTALKKEVVNTITSTVPEYGKMTKGYAEATSLIKDMESGLMLRKEGMSGRITANQTLRRLMSTMKDNKELARDLVKVLGNKTGQDLTGQVAGTTMNPALPHGLAGSGVAVGGGTLLSYLHPGFASVVAASSPRLQGEFLRLFGKVLAESAGTAPLIAKVGAYELRDKSPLIQSKIKAIQNSSFSEDVKKRYIDELMKEKK